MDIVAKVILSLEGLFFFVCFVLLIYLVFRRIKKKKEETFEDRES